MVGVLAAPAGVEDGKAAGVQQVVGLGRDAGGVERRVLQQPDELAGAVLGDRLYPRLHGRQGVRIGDLPGGDGPPRRHAVLAAEGADVGI